MRNYFYILIIFILVQQFASVQGNPLVAVPKKHTVTGCGGDSVVLEVEVDQAHFPAISWRHDSLFVDDTRYFSHSKNGRVLTITNSLPIHAGVYEATVDSKKTKQTAKVTFVVKIIDIGVRPLVNREINIKSGESTVLRVATEPAKLNVAALWMHNGKPVRTAQDGHLKFLAGQGEPGLTALEISNIQTQHAGMYEVVAKRGACEARTLITVKVSESFEEKSEHWADSLMSVLSSINSQDRRTILASSVPVFLVFLMLAIISITRMKKKERVIEEYFDLV